MQIWPWILIYDLKNNRLHHLNIGNIYIKFGDSTHKVLLYKILPHKVLP